MSRLAVFGRGTFSTLAKAWGAVGGAVGIALLPLMQGWVSLPIGVGIGLVVALIVSYVNVSAERDELKEKLHDRGKWNDIAHKLGIFGAEGQALIKKPYTAIAPMEEITAWKMAVGTYLELNWGKGHRFLFESGAGNEPTPPASIASEPDQNRWIHVQARLMTLKKLIWQASKNADRDT